MRLTSCGDASAAGFPFVSDLVSTLASGFGSTMSVGLALFLMSSFGSALTSDGDVTFTSGLDSGLTCGVAATAGLASG